MKQPLLSICIPTYNRCEVLDETLTLLFDNLEFDSERIEVIVSDNASTDRTLEVVRNYPQVIYHKNEFNIKDDNFSTVLSLAKGKYIRLFNDTLRFKPNSINFMLEKIDYHHNKDINLFFYGNMFRNRNTFKKVEFLDEFIKEVSFYTTWIANFGMWGADLDKLKDKNRYSVLQFVQVDWTFKILNFKKPSVIYFNDFFETGEVRNKGGYNVFDTFINNYLFLVEKQKLSLYNYEREKFRLFRYFVYPWLVNLFVSGKANYSFETTDAFNIIFRRYWYLPYIYPYLLLFWIRKQVNY